MNFKTCIEMIFWSFELFDFIDFIPYCIQILMNCTFSSGPFLKFNTTGIDNTYMWKILSSFKGYSKGFIQCYVYIKKMYCLRNLFSSPERKAQMSFSDQNLSIVRHHRCRLLCCYKLFTCSSSSPEPLGHFQPNFAQIILG